MPWIRRLRGRLRWVFSVRRSRPQPRVVAPSHPILKQFDHVIPAMLWAIRGDVANIDVWLEHNLQKHPIRHRTYVVRQYDTFREDVLEKVFLCALQANQTDVMNAILNRVSHRMRVAGHTAVSYEIRVSMLFLQSIAPQHEVGLSHLLARDPSLLKFDAVLAFGAMLEQHMYGLVYQIVPYLDEHSVGIFWREILHHCQDLSVFATILAGLAREVSREDVVTALAHGNSRVAIYLCRHYFADRPHGFFEEAILSGSLDMYNWCMEAMRKQSISWIKTDPPDEPGPDNVTYLSMVRATQLAIRSGSMRMLEVLVGPDIQTILPAFDWLDEAVNHQQYGMALALLRLLGAEWTARFVSPDYNHLSVELKLAMLAAATRGHFELTPLEYLGDNGRGALPLSYLQGRSPENVDRKGASRCLALAITNYNSHLFRQVLEFSKDASGSLSQWFRSNACQQPRYGAVSHIFSHARFKEIMLLFWLSGQALNLDRVSWWFLPAKLPRPVMRTLTQDAQITMESMRYLLLHVRPTLDSSVNDIRLFLQCFSMYIHRCRRAGIERGEWLPGTGWKSAEQPAARPRSKQAYFNSIVAAAVRFVMDRQVLDSSDREDRFVKDRVHHALLNMAHCPSHHPASKVVEAVREGFPEYHFSLLLPLVVKSFSYGADCGLGMDSALIGVLLNWLPLSDRRSVLVPQVALHTERVVGASVQRGSGEVSVFHSLLQPLPEIELSQGHINPDLGQWPPCTVPSGWC